MLFNELPIAFPVYDKIEKQNRHAEHVDKVCDYKLITPKNALLPWQFYIPTIGLPDVIEWKIYEANDALLAADISANIAGKIRKITRDYKDYYYYNGQALAGLNLATGFYYFGVKLAGHAIEYFSEMFFVPEIFFNVGSNGKYLKIEWYNDSDLVPIFYNDLISSKPYFRNVVYLDTFITDSEPAITEDGSRDGNDELIASFQKMVINHRITELMPDFLKRAIMTAQLHDHIIITTANGVRSGEVNKIDVTSQIEANGALSVVDIIFQEIIILKKGCGENMV